MKAKIYKGYQLGSDGAIDPYYETFNADYDASKEIDQLGNPLIFEKNVSFKGEILEWSPFLAELKGGKFFIFSCEKCGCNSCERPDHKKYSDPHFLQGNYICSNCKAESVYYSESFIKRVPTTLF